jgi:hypothetical protein
VKRHAFRRGLALGILGGAAAAVVRAIQGRRPEPAVAPASEWPPLTSVPEPAVDVVVAPGPDPQPSREAQPPVPEAEVESPATKKEPVAKKRAAKRSAPWVDPVEGSCPASHPVKAKLSSKIFHLPGMLNYERTAPDRCYIDSAAAEDDGLRPAKR